MPLQRVGKLRFASARATRKCRDEDNASFERTDMSRETTCVADDADSIIIYCICTATAARNPRLVTQQVVLLRAYCVQLPSTGSQRKKSIDAWLQRCDVTCMPLPGRTQWLEGRGAHNPSSSSV